MNKNNMTLITIGITCYNAADTIERAIRSAQKQDWPNIEVIIVDDKSADNSTQVINNLIKNDKRIKLIQHTKNLGCASARNTIINNSKGDFIAFFDDDDESASNRISTQYKYITEYEKKVNNKMIACYTTGEKCYPNGYTVHFRAIGSEAKIPFGTIFVDYTLLFKKAKGYFFGNGTPTCTLMCRKSTFEKVGKFDTAFKRIEDAEFAIRLALAGGHFIGTKEKLLKQYATVGTYKSALPEYKSLVQLINKNKDYMLKAGMYTYSLGWAKFKYFHYNKEPVKAVLQLVKIFFCHPFNTFRQLIISAPKRFIHERNLDR